MWQGWIAISLLAVLYPGRFHKGWLLHRWLNFCEFPLWSCLIIYCCVLRVFTMPYAYIFPWPSLVQPINLSLVLGGSKCCPKQKEYLHDYPFVKWLKEKEGRSCTSKIRYWSLLHQPLIMSWIAVVVSIVKPGSQKEGSDECIFGSPEVLLHCWVSSLHFA